jgi:hypothetical protein
MEDGIITISSYHVSHAVYHEVSHPASYPNGVLVPNDPSSAVARGVVYDGAPCILVYNAEANLTRGLVVFCYNNPTVHRSLLTNTNILHGGGTNSRDRKRFLRQRLEDNRHTFPVSQPLGVEQG